jgi:hypothetical protein
MPRGLPWRIYLTERAIYRVSGRLWARYMWHYWEGQGFTREELEERWDDDEPDDDA